MSVKQVIVVRRNYPKEDGTVTKIRRGKEISQACHGTQAYITRQLQKPDSCYQWFGKLIWRFLRRPRAGYYKIKLSDVAIKWIKSDFRKVVCQVKDEEELLDVEKRAREAGLETHLVVDSGKTEFDGKPTPTVVVIGPDYSDKLEPVTGNLKLY
jgi:PTH2 family peptidyl-tRNA hydrolase